MSALVSLLAKGGLKAIVASPINLLSEVVRQPLKMLDNMDERKKMELQHRLEISRKKIDAELEIHKEKKENENKIEYEKAMAEIDDMIEKKKIERQEKLAVAISNYQKTMAEASVSMANSIGNMQLDLRDRAHNLIIEKTTKYKEMQDKTIEKNNERLLQIEEKFPDGSRAKEVMIKVVENQMASIIDATSNFITTMKDDLENMLRNIDALTNQTIIQSNDYLSVETTKNISHKLRDSDVKLIDGKQG